MHRFKNYFIYHGRAYGIGTKVKIISTADFYIVRGCGAKIINRNEIIVQEHTFTGGTTEGKYYFLWKEIDDIVDPSCGARCSVELTNLNEEILEIVEPVYVELVSWKKAAISNMFDSDVCADVFGGVLTYIVVMAVGTIFQARLLIWLFSTAVFVWWLLNQYRT